MHKGEHSKAERGQGGISLPASQETVAQHTGRKDEALTPLCGEEQCWSTASCCPSCAVVCSDIPRKPQQGLCSWVMLGAFSSCSGG